MHRRDSPSQVIGVSAPGSTENDGALARNDAGGPAAPADGTPRRTSHADLVPLGPFGARHGLVGPGEEGFGETKSSAKATPTLPKVAAARRR